MDFLYCRMSKEFRLSSTSYKRSEFQKNDAKLEDFIINHFNKKPTSDGDLEDAKQNNFISGVELSTATVQLDDVVSECFEQEEQQKPQKKLSQSKIKPIPIKKQPQKKPQNKPSSQKPAMVPEEKTDDDESMELEEIEDQQETQQENKPVREICDEFHRILSIALLNRLTGKEEGKIKDEEGRIILDSTTLVELISLITGVERRKIVIHYRDHDIDVGCLCSYTPDMIVIKDIKDIKVNNEDMIYSYNAHYNALTNDFHISLSHMIHYNETQ